MGLVITANFVELQTVIGDGLVTLLVSLARSRKLSLRRATFSLVVTVALDNTVGVPFYYPV